MQKYYDRQNTPLKFHTVLCYGLLPLQLLSFLMAAAQSFFPILPYFSRLSGSVQVFYLILFFLTLCQFILALVTFIGFFHWRAYSWYSVMALFLFKMIEVTFGNVFARILYNAWYSYAFITFYVITQVILSVLLFGCIWRYYEKRKPLFILPVHTKTKLSPQPDQQSTSDTVWHPYFCPHCGSLLTEDGFCPKCQKKILSPQCFP